jgi:cell fate (sporulation/competence/biofilm development) regulator YmcA (YheA/YmcA/DUF963 family)
MEEVGLDHDRFTGMRAGNDDRKDKGDDYSGVYSVHDALSVINSLFPDNTRDTGYPCHRSAAYDTTKSKDIRMRAKTGNSLRIVTFAILPWIVLVPTGCEKPKLRSDGAKETVEVRPSERPANPFSDPAESPSGPSEGVGARTSPAPAANAPSPQAMAPTPSSLDPGARAREYARMQRMCDAQLAGIEAIQSDLARHSATLNQLRSRLQTVRALKAGAKSGGVRVERIGGESTLVNRAAEAHEIEAKIRAEEPLVAQFSKALQDAQQQYAALQHSMNQLLVE